MSKTNDTVWISRAMADSTLIKGFQTDAYEIDKEQALEAMRGSEKGVSFPKQRFPTEMYAKYPDKKEKKKPDIFMAGGFWTVSAACADVLRQFDLGDGGLYPTKLFQHDRTTPVEGEYFCLNFGNTKQAFVPEYSPKARIPDYFQPGPDNPLVWLQPIMHNDGDMAVTKIALDGPDLWIDPKVRSAFFLSDPLVQALKAAKLTRRFGLRKCRVIRNI